MSSLYKPPGYLDFQAFFDKVLEVVLEDEPEKDLFRENFLAGGFFEDVRFYRFSFYEIEEKSLEDLRQLLTDFESSRPKIIFFTYVSVQRQQLNPDNQQEVYTVYRGSNSQFLFNSYENGLYSVTEDIGKHQVEHGDNYHLERCHQEKEGEGVSYHKLVLLPCLCERTIEDRSYSREHFLSLLYASLVWKLMRDGLCASVEAVLSTNPDESLPKPNWAQNKWWYSLVISRRMRDAGREAQYVFKEEDVLHYCKEILPNRLNRTTRRDVGLSNTPYSEAMTVAMEAIDDLGERLNDLKIETVKEKILEIVQKRYPDQISFFTQTKRHEIATLIRSLERSRGGNAKVKKPIQKT